MGYGMERIIYLSLIQICSEDREDREEIGRRTRTRGRGSSQRSRRSRRSSIVHGKEPEIHLLGLLIESIVIAVDVIRIGNIIIIIIMIITIIRNGLHLSNMLLLLWKPARGL